MPPRILDYIWLISYWNSFLLTWLVVPMVQGYVDTGEFGFWNRLLDSVRVNLMFYGCMLVILSTIIVYLLISTTMRTSESLVGFLMALSNAWGLIMAMVFLGHGLVQLPRALWKSANHRRSLARLEFMAPMFKEQLVDAQADLDAVQAEIQALHRHAIDDPALERLVNELVNGAPLPEIDFCNGLAEAGRVRHNEVRPVITREHLVKLNYRAKEAVAHCGSSSSKWQELVHKAIHLQDVITNEHYNRGCLWSPTLGPPSPYRWVRFLQWLWHVHMDSLVRRALGIAAVLMSLMILWSEASLVYPRADLSIISWIIHWKRLSPTSVEFFTLGLLLYLATCTYSSFMKVRIFRYYLLVPHHTDEKSLLFFAAYFCRLAFPLGYNYLTLIQGPATGNYLQTEFSKVMGPVDLIPLLGANFNLYFSVGLVAVCVLVLFRWHGWVAKMFSSDPNFSFDDYSDAQEHLAEGRELISAARRQEERLRSRSNDFGVYAGPGGGYRSIH